MSELSASHVTSVAREPSNFLSRPAIAVVLLLVALATHAVSLLADRVLDTVDLRTHFQWAVQFHQELAIGNWYPRWMPRANGGLGEPSFIIMHPGWYWVVAGLQSFGLDTWWAMRLAAVSSTFALGVVVHTVLRMRVPIGLALGSAVLIQTMPFASFLFGFYGAMPWHFSLPLVAVVMFLSLSDSPKRFGPLLAIAVFALCICHLLVAFMTLLCVGALLVAESLQTLRPRDFARWLVAVTLGLGCAGLYLLPAVTSSPYFSSENRVDEVYLNWRNSFTFPVVSSRIYGTRWAVIQWVFPCVPLAALVVAGLLLGSTPVAQRQTGWTTSLRLVAVGSIALLLSSELAYPVYATLGFMTNVQQPYRFLTVAYLASLLALPLAIACYSSSRRRWVPYAALSVVATLSLLQFGAVTLKQLREGDKSPLGPSTMAGTFGQRGALPTGVGPQWLSYVQAGGLAAECGAVGWRCSQIKNDANFAEFQLAGSVPALLRVPRFDFPAWRVELDGQLLVARRDSATGLIAVNLPAGNHRVVLRWSPLWQEQLGLPVSALAWMVLVVWAVRRAWTGSGVTR